MWIQDYTTSREAVEVGDIVKTGSADKGGVIFRVDNWKANDKIWPHDKMFGVFEVSFGE